ncbi:hypothetical protein CcaverHIS002_0111520 [Cutaneotrichosporon cavernicola]|uniref:Barwin domain-containing protein n=1 Tax=Cutaneotrichosporon cavernicola TaxID=279322 RepID=A0AA48I2K9_9TREE|nr:uncharacterized protein CcaverHIS019_0111420 [Cutaneotrichosporon cavernicola]BEI80623.1 hypothetical protein CcaverHIS002_0111520 [Cutaneotrichosporon cavernicola]BEI88424.1 hypothetical protein CcaverHIS019_0111420 [Cutaneotrichosporon cavernicola]BEI96197.1 hypothetical protein CcaverHIS631_0111460 [Cutaneotrichosporon cavernicola]BEJ03968.1 hypothetical protein CcaverHIS641_0111430 [Cutaneotrichosporon cavernicola]
MFSKTIIFAALAALAVAAPTPEYGRHRQGGHRNGGHHNWNGDNSASTNSGNGSGNSDNDSSNKWSGSNNSNNQDNSTNQDNGSATSESATTSADQSQETGSNSGAQVDGSNSTSSGPAVSGGFTSIASYYDISNPSENEGESAGSVACSSTKYSNSDAIVAIASQQYSSSVCGKQVRITDQSTGNTVEATIVDECMSCQNNQLDLTPSLWSQLHGQSTSGENDGEFPISWEYI